MTTDQASASGESEERSTQNAGSVKDLEKFFDDIFLQRWPSTWMRRFHWDEPSWAELGPVLVPLPKIQVLEEDERILVRAELPGVHKDNVEVIVDERSVTIRGHRTLRTETEGADYRRTETTRGEFSRTVSLPDAVDWAAARGRLSNGLLELILPRQRKRRPYRLTLEG